MTHNPYEDIENARKEILAGELAAAHGLITESVPGVTSIRMINNEEGSLYWVYRTAEDSDGEWVEIDHQRTLDDENLADALFEATNSIGLTWMRHIEPYLLTQVGPESYGYGPSMPVNKHSGEFDYADLDLNKIKDAYKPYEKGYDEDLSKIVLVYINDEGEIFEQPLCDLTDVGTLIDPDTGDDLDLVGWKRS